jgi:hypothetical protein
MSKEVEFLERFFQEAIDQIVTNLHDMKDSKGHNRYASGVTGQEVGAINKDMVNEYADKWVVQIYMPYYYEFIDEGVRGWKNEKRNTGKFQFKKNSRPIPRKVILDFMLNRGIVFNGYKGLRASKGISRTLKKQTIKDKLNQLAYVIGRSIKKKGTEGVPFYSSVISEDFIRSFETEFLNVYGDKLLNDIEFLFKPTNN